MSVDLKEKLREWIAEAQAEQEARQGRPDANYFRGEAEAYKRVFRWLED